MENKFKFYNTLTRNIDTVIPNEEGKIAKIMPKVKPDTNAEEILAEL